MKKVFLSLILLSLTLSSVSVGVAFADDTDTTYYTGQDGVLYTQIIPGVHTTPTNLTELVDRWISLLNQLVPWLIVVIGSVFLNGFIAYIGAGGNEEKLKDGKKRIYFGFLGLFIVMSFWGIAYMIKKSFFG
jgi:hypothetical protein